MFDLFLSSVLWYSPVRLFKFVNGLKNELGVVLLWLYVLLGGFFFTFSHVFVCGCCTVP